MGYRLGSFGIGFASFGLVLSFGCLFLEKKFDMMTALLVNCGDAGSNGVVWTVDILRRVNDDDDDGAGDNASSDFACL